MRKTFSEIFLSVYCVNISASLKEVTQINKHGWNVCFVLFSVFLWVFLTIRRRFLSALKSTSYSCDTEHQNLLKWVNNGNPRLKSDTY